MVTINCLSLEFASANSNILMMKNTIHVSLFSGTSTNFTINTMNTFSVVIPTRGGATSSQIISRGSDIWKLCQHFCFSASAMGNTHLPSHTQFSKFYLLLLPSHLPKSWKYCGRPDLKNANSSFRNDLSVMH